MWNCLGTMSLAAYKRKIALKSSLEQAIIHPLQKKSFLFISSAYLAKRQPAHPLLIWFPLAFLFLESFPYANLSFLGEGAIMCVYVCVCGGV